MPINTMVSGKEGKKGLYPDALEKYSLFFVHIYPEGLSVIYSFCFLFCLSLPDTETTNVDPWVQ